MITAIAIVLLIVAVIVQWFFIQLLMTRVHQVAMLLENVRNVFCEQFQDDPEGLKILVENRTCTLREFMRDPYSDFWHYSPWAVFSGRQV